MKWQATMTTRGRVTIPRGVRSRLGMKPGDSVEFDDTGGSVLLRVVGKQSTKEWFAAMDRRKGDAFLKERKQPKTPKRRIFD